MKSEYLELPTPDYIHMSTILSDPAADVTDRPEDAMNGPVQYESLRSSKKDVAPYETLNAVNAPYSYRSTENEYDTVCSESDSETTDSKVQGSTFSQKVHLKDKLRSDEKPSDISRAFQQPVFHSENLQDGEKNVEPTVIYSNLRLTRD